MRLGAHGLKLDKVIPYVGIVYDLTPPTSVYASYTDIHRLQSNYGVDNLRDLDHRLSSAATEERARALPRQAMQPFVAAFARSFAKSTGVQPGAYRELHEVRVSS